MPQVWHKTLTRLAMLVVSGLAIGWLYDRPMIGLLVALAVALAWHLYWLFKLHRWLNGAKMPFLPEGSGIWPQVFARYDHIKARTKQRNKSYKALLKQMRQATRSYPDGGVILNNLNEIVSINRVAQEMLGLKRKQDRGLRLENLIRDPEFVDYLHSNVYDSDVEITSPVNVGRWLSCHQVPYGLDQKLMLIRDITQQRQTEQMRRDFVANASHELRTPLTVITGYLDALVDDEHLSADLQAPVEEMQRQSNRMRLLVDDLLRLSELESEDTAPADKAVDIAAIVAAAGQEARVMPGCPQTINVAIDSDAQLFGDEADIQSVLTNLVSNAVRYTPEDGEIEIRWSTAEKGGRLTVSDSGAGISSAHFPRLTERFYRVESGRQRMGGEGGTGLGLAIVKHALHRHEATLEIESELGVGSSFTCDFPPERIVAIA